VISQHRLSTARGLLAIVFILLAWTTTLRAQQAQQVDTASIVQKVDAAVKARIDGIAGYTVTEHYAVYRNKDEVHPAAEMTVKTTYLRESGKSYVILSETGSEMLRHLVLGAILDNEKRLNLPGVREGAWFTSANYEMMLKPGGVQSVRGRDCLALSITPRRKTPFLIGGTLWVDAEDGSVVQVEGTAAKNSSLVTGPTQIMRQYTRVDGFSQATRVRAVSSSFLFGQTVVKIEYEDYKITLHAD